MNEAIQDYIKKYSEEIQEIFFEIRELIINCAPYKIEEKLWAKLPSFYVDRNFIRVIPFNDHININAIAISEHIPRLSNYKITPKAMLQIYVHQEIPYDVLKLIFKETLIR